MRGTNLKKIIGELEKRIPNKYSFSSEVIIITKENLEEVVGEALEDFPKINDVCLFETDDNWKVLRWLEKWFGKEGEI